MAKFSFLSANFGRTAFAADYDHWTFIDFFGHSRIYKSLLTSYKAVIAGPTVSTVRVGSAKASSVVSKSVVNIPSKSKKKRLGNPGSGAAASSIGGDPVQGSSLSPSLYICIYVHFQTVDFVEFHTVYSFIFIFIQKISSVGLQKKDNEKKRK